MADKQVSFSVVVGGIPALKGALKGVTESARAMQKAAQDAANEERKQLGQIWRDRTKLANDSAKLARQVAQDAEKAAQRAGNEERKELAATWRARQKAAADATKLAEKTAKDAAKAEERWNKQRSRIQTNSALMAGRIASKSAKEEAGGNNFGDVLSRLASFGGFAKSGQMINMAGELGVGSETAAGGAGMGAIAAAALPAAVALGAIVIASKLVETGFAVVSTQAKYLATSFLGAISTIGGAKNLQETLVDAANKEAQTKVLRMSVLPEERSSEADIANLTGRLAKRTELGAYGSDDWRKAINILGVSTGKQKSFVKDPSTLEFLGQLAHVGGADLSTMATLYGQLRQSNPNFSDNEVQQLLMDSTALGRKTSFDINELPDSKVLLTQSTKLAGDRGTNLKQLLGIGSILKPYAEGGLLGSGVEAQAFLSEAGKSHRHGENWGFKWDKGGNITNLREGIAYAVANRTNNASPYAKEQRAERFVEHMSAAAGVSGDDSKEVQYSKVMKLMESLDGLTMSSAQLRNESIETISTQDRLRAEFNSLTDQMGTALLPVLQKMVPDVQAFSKALIDNKDQILATIQGLMNAMRLMIPAVLEVATMLAYLGSFFGLFVSTLAKFLDGLTGMAFHKELQPFEDAGTEIAKSQASLIVAIDDLKTTFANYKPAAGPQPVDEVSVPTVVRPAAAHDVVNAIKDLHQTVRQLKQTDF